MPARFHPVTVSNRAGRAPGGAPLPSLTWGEPCATPSAAARAGKAELDAGRATLAFVVCEGADGSRQVMPEYVAPASARKIIRHYEALWAMCQGEEE